MFEAIGIMACAYALSVLISNIRTDLEEKNAKPRMQAFLDVLCAIFSIFSLPVTVVAILLAQPSARQKEKLRGAIESRDMIIATKDQTIKLLDERIAHYDALIVDDRKRCREEGYRTGYSDAKKFLEDRTEYACAKAFSEGYAEGQHDHSVGINRLEDE